VPCQCRRLGARLRLPRASRKVRLLPEMAGCARRDDDAYEVERSAAAITMRSALAWGGACAGRAAIRLRRAARTARPESHRQSVHRAPRRDLRAAVADLQFAPAADCFAGEQIAEDDAVAAQQHPAAGFDAAVAIGTLGVEERPAAGSVTGAAGGGDSFAGSAARLVFRVRQRGVTRARRFSKPSAVTRPAATSSQRPVSISALRRPVARTMSGRKARRAA